MTKAAADAAPPRPRPPAAPAGVWLGALADTGIASPPEPYPCRCAGAGGCKRGGRYCTCYGRRIEPHLPETCCAILNLSRAAWAAIRQPLSAPVDVEVILAAPLDIEAAVVLVAPLDIETRHVGDVDTTGRFCARHGHFDCPVCQGRPAPPFYGRHCAKCGDRLSEWLPFGVTLHILCTPPA